MVDELVGARVVQGEQPETATEHVLNDLGNPRQLARRYDGDHRYLIGPKHYDDYIDLLTAIATRVLPLAAIVIFAASILSGDGAIGSLVGGAVADSLWTTFTIGVQIAFWVTLAFVVMERTQRPGASTEAAGDVRAWTVADLPPAKPKRQISVSDALSSLAFTVFIGIVFVFVYRNGISMYLGDGGPDAVDGNVAFFNPEIPAAVAWLVLGLLAVDAMLEVVKYAVGYWVRFVAFTQIALNVAWAAVAMVIIGVWYLVNPGVRDAVSDDAAELLLGSWFEQSVLASVLVISAIGIWEAVRGYLARHPHSDPWTV